MKVSFYFCLSGMCFLVAFLLLMSGVRRQEEALAARIAPAVLRFHVLANSDSPEDQAIKLQVKDLLLKEIREGAGDAAQNKEELCRYISENRHELEAATENYMAECLHREIICAFCAGKSFPIRKTYCILWKYMVK